MDKGHRRTFGSKTAPKPGLASGTGAAAPAGVPGRPAGAVGPQRKRTAAISIGAIGLTAVTLVGVANWQSSCPQPDPKNPNPQPQNCGSSSRTSSSSMRGWSSSSSSSQQPQSTVQRGGFGHSGSFFSGGG